MSKIYFGFIDGLRGTGLNMTADQALGASHAGECDQDVEALAKESEISTQLDAIGPETLRLGLKESGAYDADELTDDAANRLRAVWFAACDIRENK